MTATLNSVIEPTPTMAIATTAAGLATASEPPLAAATLPSSAFSTPLSSPRFFSSLLSRISSTSTTTTSSSSSSKSSSSSCSTSFASHIRRIWLRTSSSEFAAAESAVLSVVKTPHRQELVPIFHDGREEYLNTVHFSRFTAERQEAEKNGALASTVSSLVPSFSLPHKLVLLHGFGAGLALYMTCFDALAHHFNDVYALDWLGCGRSSRPPFRAKSVAETEDFFTSSLESWRKKQGIEKMTLCAHSLGAIFATAYAEKHPERVERLVLISPAGVPKRPEEEKAEERKKWEKSGLRYRLLYGALTKMWEWGVTPQSAVRWIGPFPLGRKMIEGYVTRRFVRGAEEEPEFEDVAASHSPSSSSSLSSSPSSSFSSSSPADKTRRFLARNTILLDKSAISSYLFHNFTQSGSGEFALSKVLAPGVYAYYPLGPRLIQNFTGNRTDVGGVRGGEKGSVVWKTRIPTTLIYGTDDWMTPELGVEVAEEMRRSGGSAAAVRVKNAGHQVFLDNPIGFAEAVLYACTFDEQDHHRPGTGLERKMSDLTGNTTNASPEIRSARPEWSNTTTTADRLSRSTLTALRSLYSTGFRNIIVQDRV